MWHFVWEKYEHHKVTLFLIITSPILFLSSCFTLLCTWYTLSLLLSHRWVWRPRISTFIDLAVQPELAKRAAAYFSVLLLRLRVWKIAMPFFSLHYTSLLICFLSVDSSISLPLSISLCVSLSLFRSPSIPLCLSLILSLSVPHISSHTFFKLFTPLPCFSFTVTAALRADLSGMPINTVEAPLLSGQSASTGRIEKVKLCWSLS